MGVSSSTGLGGPDGSLIFFDANWPDNIGSLPVRQSGDADEVRCIVSGNVSPRLGSNSVPAVGDRYISLCTWKTPRTFSMAFIALAFISGVVTGPQMTATPFCTVTPRLNGANSSSASNSCRARI